MAGVNENSSGYLEVDFYNKEKVLEAPASVIYRIDCITNNVEVKGDTPVSPAASISIPLTPEDNMIINPVNDIERRLVTVTAVFGTNDALVDDFEYPVNNVRKAS